MFFRQLRRNLAGGGRVALFRPVRRGDFRISALQLLGVVVLSIAFTSLVDLAVTREGAEFNPAGIGGQLGEMTILLGICWLVGAAMRAPAMALALPIVFLGSGWLPDLVFAALITAADRWLTPSSPWLLTALWWSFIIWSFAIAWRSVGVVLENEGRHSPTARFGAAAALFGGMLLIALLFPGARTWTEAPDRTTLEAEGVPHVESEEVLAKQPRILFDTLTGLDETDPGTQSVYFIGFAGDASQDVFRNDMESAQDVMDERLGTDGRSVVLINSPRTVLDTPLATLTNLRAALSTVGQLIDPDKDLVVVYLSSHGTEDHQLLVSFPPLELQQLTPTALSRMFQESGIKWKVVIVSACYSGGYVEPLKDAYTVVMTSSRTDRRSFGCDNGSEFTYFGQALFQEALRKADSLLAAFDLARASIAAREKAERLTPSEPQLFVGDEIRQLLERRRKPVAVAAR
jgi:hypothetical protein